MVLWHTILGPVGLLFAKEKSLTPPCGLTSEFWAQVHCTIVIKRCLFSHFDFSETAKWIFMKLGRKHSLCPPPSLFLAY